MRKQNGKKPKKLQWSMIFLLVMGWLLPVVILSAGVTQFVAVKMQRQAEETATTSMDKVVENCQLRLNGAMTASRQASYSGIIRDSYRQYQKDGNEQALYTAVNQYLQEQYKYNENFLGTMLYLTEEPETIYFTYNNMGATYEIIRFFRETGLEVVQEAAKNLGTGIVFTEAEGHLYMIRNLVLPDYSPFAVLVMELNKENMFQGVESTAWYLESMLYLDGVPLGNDEGFGMLPVDLMESSRKSICIKEGKETYVYFVSKLEQQKLAYVVRLDNQAMGYEQETMKYIVGILLFFMIPLTFLVLYFFHSKVTKPIQALTRAAGEVEKANYGYQVEPMDSSEEFRYLGETFNRMSDRLKLQFEQIYLEELALKDANIKALQAQINPHFLNNTLEIINWAARMGDNEKVCGMMEALSTMMEATNNRKKQSLIPLSEELSYVEAYLYIITQRFGDKLRVERTIDKGLLQVEVPRLIIQPIIENAVEYGMDRGRKKEGVVVGLRAYRKEDKLYIEVKNNGQLTKEDTSKIEMLLGDTAAENIEKSSSLGISNVNRRLKIIYGEECGLTIKSDKEMNTVSTIIAKMNNEPIKDKK